ncbi:hypothetical protein SGPA1_40284 [Streptomyces misionensis JCM 4497]
MPCRRLHRRLVPAVPRPDRPPCRTVRPLRPGRHIDLGGPAQVRLRRQGCLRRPLPGRRAATPPVLRVRGLARLSGRQPHRAGHQVRRAAGAGVGGAAPPRPRRVHRIGPPGGAGRGPAAPRTAGDRRHPGARRPGGQPRRVHRARPRRHARSGPGAACGGRDAGARLVPPAAALLRRPPAQPASDADPGDQRPGRAAAGGPRRVGVGGARVRAGDRGPGTDRTGRHPRPRHPHTRGRGGLPRLRRPERRTRPAVPDGTGPGPARRTAAPAEGTDADGVRRLALPYLIHTAPDQRDRQYRCAGRSGPRPARLYCLPRRSTGGAG